MNKGGIMEDDRKGTWVDVTGDCGTRPASDDSCLYVCHPGKGYVRALLGKHGIYGHCVEGGAAGDSPNARGYRLARPTADTWAIEHFIPDPEPVIAYKAVIVDGDKYVSTFAGIDRPYLKEEIRTELTYAVGDTTESPHGRGIHCFDSLEAAKDAYPAGEQGEFIRKAGRVAILKVEAFGEALYWGIGKGAVCYPSVKVLSVAWEGEPPKPKEEWVDVTEELRGEMGIAGYVNVWHGDICVLSFGSRLHEDSMGKANYRVTTTGKGSAGRFKVEKRNG